MGNNLFIDQLSCMFQVDFFLLFLKSNRLIGIQQIVHTGP